MNGGMPTGGTAGDHGNFPKRRPFAENVWRAPLVPAVLAVTAGVVADRFLVVSLPASLAAALAGLVAWFVTRAGPQRGLPLAYLALAGAALGAAHHHTRVRICPADDLGNLAREDPQLVRLRGVIDEEPTIVWRVRGDPLQSFAGPDPTFAVLRAEATFLNEAWHPVSGRARLVVGEHLEGLHIGDEVEVVGWLEAPSGPANPGGADPAAQLRDQRIRAVVRVRQTPDAVTRLAERWPRSVRGWLAVIRGWGQRQLRDALPERVGLASALLLGEGSAMTFADWERYMRTGVVHVLAVSGQHLVVLAVFVWWVLRLTGVPRRRGAWLVAMLLSGYALLAGGEAPVLRAAVMVCVACGALVLRRQIMAVNSFALAWLIVLAVNPTDLFTPGCQLSFLGTAVLYWCMNTAVPHDLAGGSVFLGSSVLYWCVSFLRRETDPLARLVAESRPRWQRVLRELARLVALAYLVNLVCWVAIAPLLLFHYHLAPPAALLIGPPTTLLASAALVAGFLIFPAAVIWRPLALAFGRMMEWCLAGCDGLVDRADRWEGTRWYVGDVPAWWVVGFYLALGGMLTLRHFPVRRPWYVAAAAAWLCVGLVSGSARPAPEELRCTFLSVGHGGCTVLETPDGRTLLYDVGAITGPDVTRRHVAPFLWQRGIRRIDELFLSHADLDHFNGVIALLERFAVGQVTWTPSFARRPTPGAQAAVDAFRRWRVPVRVVSAGDRLEAGDVTLDVLHPPASGPEGNENARSLVLHVQYADRSILLTGDLEGAGLERVLGLPPLSVDVLMAPHHGSRAANTPELAAWARPLLTVSSQGRRDHTWKLQTQYLQAGSQFLDTAQHGAVTLRCAAAGVTIETHRWRQPFDLPGRRPP